MPDAAENIRLAIEIVTPFAVGHDETLSRERLFDLLGNEDTAWKVIDGFLGLTVSLLQELEFNVDPPIDPATMLQKIAAYTIEHPDEG